MDELGRWKMALDQSNIKHMAGCFFNPNLVTPGLRLTGHQPIKKKYGGTQRSDGLRIMAMEEFVLCND
jgi:hypothetical protein